MYKPSKLNNSTSVILRRRSVDITDMYIDSIGNIIDKFYPEDEVRLVYKKGELKSGMIEVDIKIKDQEPKPFLWIIALAVPLQRVKSLMLRNIKYIIFDEFIINSKLGEKYLNNETFKFKELFKTFQRENRQLKCYFLGNPYSKYNPYFTEFKFPLAQIKQGTIISEGNAVVENYKLTDELIEFIKKNDPLYQFDDTYTRYAYDGISVNDQNIYLVDKQPENYQLWTIFRLNNVYLNIFTGNNSDYSYWISATRDNIIGKRRNVYCIDFSDLIDQQSMMWNVMGFDRWAMLKQALMSRNVAFKDLEAYYLIEAVFPKL